MIGDLLYRWLGISGTGPYYGFWSGFGSDFAEFSIPIAILGAYYKHNCHYRRCWRIGRHHIDGTPWCNKHHQGAREAKGRQGS